MLQNPARVNVGIAGVGAYLPKTHITAQEIARASGMPEWVVREKLGIEGKTIGDPNEHPNEMGIRAALDCLSNANISPDEIDVVLCTTEEWKEYLLWTAGIHLAYEIGATRAWAMDVHMRCATTIGAMKMAKDMMLSDPDVNTVLIAGGYRVADVINFKNPRTSFLWNIGAGAGALLLKRNHPRNHFLGAHLMCDGSMANHVIVPASGTKRFPTDAAVAEGLFYFDLVEPEAMKNRLNAVSMDNWLHCIDQALRKSNLTRADVSFLNMVLVKPSAHREMLERLGLNETQSVYLSNVGHIGEQDTILNIVQGVKQGKLKDGDVMVMVGAGIGYVWAAGVVKWGKDEG